MKKYAFFLPQFHEIDQNNKWWGEGFTEWVNVKKARSLASWHIQPQEPLNSNYYNLLDKETVLWQTALMHDYGIDGLIYYHYYFMGEKLLEKPAENLLKWEEIDQPFFFCWANHSWIKSWEGKKEILMEQKYGEIKDWKKHFDYLLPFFKDYRYEKRDNRPIFMLFKSDFPQKDEMMTYFNEQCKLNGFDGIYVIDTLFSVEDVNNFKISGQYLEKAFLREPNAALDDYLKGLGYSWKRIKNKIYGVLAEKGLKTKLRYYEADELYKKIFERKAKINEYYKGLFFSWDNTPRHGYRGYVIKPVSKTVLFQYLDSLCNEEYVFINAWNEWAEGMMLEPTEKEKLKYLEWIKEWAQKTNT